MARETDSKIAEIAGLCADFYWETDSHLTIKALMLLSDGAHCEDIFSLEGRRLDRLLGDQNTLEETDQFAERHISVHRLQKAELNAVLWGRRHADSAAWSGLGRLSGEPPPKRSSSRQLFDKFTQARERELQSRREAETLLDALRLLTGESRDPQDFEALLALLAPVLEFSTAIVVQQNWDGKPEIVASYGRHDLTLSLLAIAPDMFTPEQPAFLLEADDIARLMPDGMPEPWQCGLCVHLRTGARAALLIGLSGVAGAFGARHLGLGARFGLVATEALMKEEEQRRVTMAAKLASLGEMAAGIIHEINQPLGTLSLLTERLQLLAGRGDVGGEKATEIANALEREINRTQTVIASVKTLARQADRTDDFFDLSEVVQEAAVLSRHKLVTHEIAFAPDLAAGALVRGKRADFLQVCLNIISNACDALSAEQERTDAQRTLHVSCDAEKTCWVLRFRDTGTGFSEPMLREAFTSFVTSKAVGKGTGLGLSLSQRIIRAMGGEIAVANWDHGAEVRLDLPKAEPAD